MTIPEREKGEHSSAHHVPVLVREVLHHLDLQPGQTIVDGTVGAGGHSRKIIEKIGPQGTLIGLDRDPMMLDLAKSVLTEANCHLHQSSYSELTHVLQNLKIQSVDRILLDLGLSSDQLADQERGFSFDSSGPLDLRFDTSQGKPTWELLRILDEKELLNLFQQFGEERFSHQIARKLKQHQKSNPVKTAKDLASLIHEAIPQKHLRSSKKNPATRIFQALRIASNEELTHLETALNKTMHDSLSPDGRLVIISFHSLEDRMVKQAFRNKKLWQNLTDKPTTASPAEQRMNPRSRTAKLRAARKN